MKRLLFISFFASAFALPACVRAQNSATASAPAAEHGDKLRVAGIPNFGKIDEHLYRGAQPRAGGLPELKKLGVTTIVDLRGEDPSKSKWEQKHAESLGMRFVHIPVSGWAPPSDTQVAEFLNIFRANPEERVFVHCRYGDDRTGVFVAVYRMAFDKFLSDEAVHEMYFFGFNGFWHPSMRAFIRDFPNKLSTDPLLQTFKPAN
jgi:protein tyrosine/serine phosphatase